MVRINVADNCGNSPKGQLLKEFNSAFVQKDIETLTQYASDDIQWHIVGDKQIKGKLAFLTELEDIKSYAVKELTIDSVITHGKAGAVNGTLIMQDDKTYGFCDVYEFSSAKGSSIKSITSYVIAVDSD